MATATVTRTVTAADMPKFRTKRERKAYRKTLRLKLANKVADVSMNRHEKSEFYRKLRLVKIRRRKIADAVVQVVHTAADVQREIERVHNRIPASNPALVAWAAGVARSAVGDAEEAAASFGAFARKTVLRYRAVGT